MSGVKEALALLREALKLFPPTENFLFGSDQKRDRGIACIKDAIATLEAAPAPAPDWQLVPKEPTEEMNIAGLAIGDYPWDGKKESRIYRAMLAAAPAPPKPESST